MFRILCMLFMMTCVTSNAIAECPTDLVSELPKGLKNYLPSDMGVEQFVSKGIFDDGTQTVALIATPDWYFACSDYPTVTAETPNKRILLVFQKINRKWQLIGREDSIIKPIENDGKFDMDYLQLNLEAEKGTLKFGQYYQIGRINYESSLTFLYQIKVKKLRLIACGTHDVSNEWSVMSGEDQDKYLKNESAPNMALEGYSSEFNYLTGQGWIETYLVGNAPEKKELVVTKTPIFLGQLGEFYCK